MQRDISLSAQDITEAEIEAVVAVLRSDRLSLGPKLGEFEQSFKQRTGVKHAICCSSGTAGLHVCWHAMGIGPGDEVITTPFSFIASSNSIMFDGGRPVFVDIDPRTWQIDTARIEAAITPKTKAILPVDIFGSLPDMDAVWEIARKHNLRVLEDSCEALGATYQGRPAGTLGEAGLFAFYPNKQITTGEGGMIVTNDDEIAFKARSLINQGRDPDAGWLAHARLGFNYRLCDIQAAIGVVQMQRLDEILAKRARVAKMYQERLADEPRLSMQLVPNEVGISWFVFVVRLSDDYTQEQRDTILAGLREKGIGCNNYFTPIHLQPFYRAELGCRPGDYPITEALSCRTIALPFHNHLTSDDVDYVVQTLRGLL
ncbi:MAG: DegT/DnrJ/EryC1/StrS family aminotransferase [Phycisphaerae bacterium]|nr:DegT/DnrJ/EryC1/StrS family aminotransferase [Phycisphaerae bacterium]